MTEDWELISSINCGINHWYIKEDYMDTTKFVEIAKDAQLNFIYSGERMKEEKICQKIINKTHAEGNISAVIISNSFSNQGLVITDKGIWFETGSGKLHSFWLDIISSYPLPFLKLISRKTKGAFTFDKFLLHNVCVTQTLLMKNLKVEFILWNIQKKKTIDFSCELVVTGADASTCNELTKVFMTLSSKTGTEYVPEEEAKNTDETPVMSVEKAPNTVEKVPNTVEKDPNTFEFLWSNLFTNIHSIIKLDTDNIVISKFKFTDNNTIQIPIKDPVTISRSAVASIKKGRSFSLLTLLGAMLIGCLIGTIIGGIFTIIIVTLLCFSIIFPRMLTIKRKDGTKFKIRLNRDKTNTESYERLMKVIFN